MSRSPGHNSIMLFGVRLTAQPASSFRKTVSMTNLSHYDNDHLPQDINAHVAAGYDSDDVVHASATARTRDRKRGVPWTEDEHRFFLLGLQKVGKGDWRGISRNFVKTRTPTQVASHAQKYFLRRRNHTCGRRRSSLFDITTHTFSSPSMEEEEELVLPQETGSVGLRVPLSKHVGGSINMWKMRRSAKVIPSSKMADLNLNEKSPTRETSDKQSGSDNIINVA
ncbi:transcription factor MYB1R1 [Euphorbia lathyris]|uniref:transcription factor MYB1R1 n=1 Tax=Euphorbia lathyris TaxID=212925 RepID=UPI0033136314